MYTVAEPNWFFSPGNWHVLHESRALTNNPGAYSKLGFHGTGLRLGVDLTLFQTTSPQPSDYPRLRWRVDNGPWMEQLTAAGMLDVVLARGLAPADHSLEVVFDAVQRNRDRWDAPAASIAFTGVTVLNGELMAPSLRSQRWIVFGDSMTEAVVCKGRSYQSADQCAGQTWGLQVGEALDAEVGIVGFTSQGYGTPGPAASRVPEFHGSSARTWEEFYRGQSRSYAGVDAILVNHGTNDVALDDADLEASIIDFLQSVRTGNPSTAVYLVVPFGGARRAQVTNAYHTYQAMATDPDCYLVDITDDDPILTEDLDGDTSYATYSWDGLHPNQAGHDRVAKLVTAAIAAAQGPE